MKTLSKFIILLVTLSVYSISCGNAYKIEIPHWDYTQDDNDDTTNGDGLPDPDVPKEETLLVPEQWQTEIVNDGVKYHHFERFDDITKGYQIVNVLEIDLNNPEYKIKFTYSNPSQTLSTVMKNNPTAIGGINGGYETDAIYIKVNNSIISEVSLPPNHLRFWKHEAAVFSDGGRRVGIVYAGKDGEKAIETYKNLEASNIIASAPMLVDNFDPKGESFVDGSYSMEELEQFDYEDYRRHQGVRHPRTVYALTRDNDLLLITIDGRWPGKAEGMNAAEVTKFIVKHFNPQYAINMDGGGSTTLCVKGFGHPETNVVNYPTDGGTHDHTGERSVTTHILVVPAE